MGVEAIGSGSEAWSTAGVLEEGTSSSTFTHSRLCQELQVVGKSRSAYWAGEKIPTVRYGWYTADK